MPEYLAVVRALPASRPVRMQITALHLDEARKFLAARSGVGFHSSLHAYDLFESRQNTTDKKWDWVLIDQRFAPGENNSNRPTIVAAKTETKPLIVSNYERMYKDYDLIKAE